MGLPPVLHRLTVFSSCHAVFARRSNMSVVPQCPPVPAPSMASGLLDSWVDGCAAAVEGFGKCWAATLQRGPAAFDLPRWVALTAGRRGAVLDHAARDRVRRPARAAPRLLGVPAARGSDVGAAAAGRPRLVHRRLLAGAEPDGDDPRGRPRARAVARLGRRHQGDRERDDRGLHRRGRPRRRPLRWACQPDRRLPGGLARDDLRRPEPRAHQHAHDRGRSDRLPRRRAGYPRGYAPRRAGRRFALLRGTGGVRRRNPPGPAHAHRASS